MVRRSLSYLFKCILVSCIYSEEVDLKSTVFSFRFTFNDLRCLKHNVEVFPLHIHFMFSECSSLKCDETFIKPLGWGREEWLLSGQALTSFRGILPFLRAWCWLYTNVH